MRRNIGLATLLLCAAACTAPASTETAQPPPAGSTQVDKGQPSAEASPPAAEEPASEEVRLICEDRVRINADGKEECVPPGEPMGSPPRR